MTTLLTVGNSGGERRCDAKCHDAHEPECDCICGGRFHGKGGDTAARMLMDDACQGRFGEQVRVAVTHFQERLL